jgi:hypothetical protein
MRRNPDVTTAVVLSGKGWAARNETAELASAFGGRLYSDRGISALVRDIVSTVRTVKLRVEPATDSISTTAPLAKE